MVMITHRFVVCATCIRLSRLVTSVWDETGEISVHPDGAIGFLHTRLDLDSLRLAEKIACMQVMLGEIETPGMRVHMSWTVIRMALEACGYQQHVPE